LEMARVMALLSAPAGPWRTAECSLDAAEAAQLSKCSSARRDRAEVSLGSREASISWRRPLPPTDAAGAALVAALGTSHRLFVACAPLTLRGLRARATKSGRACATRGSRGAMTESVGVCVMCVTRWSLGNLFPRAEVIEAFLRGGKPSAEAPARRLRLGRTRSSCSHQGLDTRSLLAPPTQYVPRKNTKLSALRHHACCSWTSCWCSMCATPAALGAARFVYHSAEHDFLHPLRGGTVRSAAPTATIMHDARRRGASLALHDAAVRIAGTHCRRAADLRARKML
jgi:hypothetical protein